MSKTLGYARVSTAHQAKDGTSIPDQRERAPLYAEMKQLPEWELVKDRIFVDAGESSDIPFMQRPAGAACCAALTEGDHLIIVLFDRAFRGAGDVEATMAYLTTRQVTVHILDMNIDSSTHMGQCMLSIMGAVKRLEKQTIKERTGRGYRRARKEGLAAAASNGWTHTTGKVGKYKKLTIDRPYRDAAEHIVKMHEGGMSFRAIYFGICTGRRKKDSKLPPLLRGAREWSYGSIVQAYQAAKAGYPLPNYDTRLGPSASELVANPGQLTATASAPPTEGSCLSPASSDPPPA
jgi:DNA invertase Pin-like site-specific DNA recombinase